MNIEMFFPRRATRVLRGLWTCSRVLALMMLVGAAGSRLVADTTWSFAVELKADVDPVTPKITLHWKADPWEHVYDSNYVPDYTVYRRTLAATSWTQIGYGDGENHVYEDTTVTVGVPYEYKVFKNFNYATMQYTGVGYIRSGINIPEVENRGTVLLLVDNSVAGDLATEIATLRSDLLGDGWKVKTVLDFGRNDDPDDIRNAIVAEHDNDSSIRTVFILGHIPVVHAGNANPDGHLERALPADGFYGDLDGTWGSRDGNGVYLDTALTLPSAVELEVGRVDFANMPATLTALSTTEVELLRGYLNKDHAYRHSANRPTHRALMGDTFGDHSGEPFSPDGYMNFGGLVGIDPGDLVQADTSYAANSADRWITKLSTNDYLWSYGSGAGSGNPSGFSRCGTNGDEGGLIFSDMYSEAPKGTFYMLFGSWVCDWASDDNILRAALIGGDGLMSCWAGRPYYYFHAMALGETTGQGYLLSVNNDGTFYTTPRSVDAHGIWMAMMGDPTMRQDFVEPVSAVSAERDGANVNIGWTAPTGTVLGYYVYRSSNIDGPFTTHLGSMVTGSTSFVDSSPLSSGSNAYYMVRAVKLETTASGSYNNLSQGAFCTLAPVTGTVWFTDDPPAGASTSTSGDTGAWTLVTTGPAPYHGAGSRQSVNTSGLHEHSFNFAYTGMTLASGDVIYTYVYIDPTYTPTEIMLSFNDGSSWEHRAYWGANSMTYGTNGTASRFNVGSLPATGQWVRLEVLADDVGLVGETVTGMGFSEYDGRATWNEVGKSTATVDTPPGTVWFADNAPAGAYTGTNGDTGAWTLVTSNPSPFAGTGSRISPYSAGFHEHSFNGAYTGMSYSSGEVIYAYVYIDGTHVPDEIMLSFFDGTSWEHRAYWGNNTINYGTNGTATRFRAGDIPSTTGQWVRLEVNASDVGLVGETVTGMGFSLYGGQIYWNAVGKYTP
jgi:hypothetical protein